MNNRKAFRHSALFGGIVLALSYFVFWGPLALFRIPTISFVDKSKGPAWAIALFMLGGFMPSIVGLALSRITDGKTGFRSLLRRSCQIKIGFRWYLYIVGFIALGGSVQILMNALFGNTFDFKLFLQQLPSLLPLIIIGPLSEEYGWRGYLLDKLQENFSPLLSAVATGILWGFWHYPLFNMVGTSQNTLQIPFLSFLVSTIATSIIVSWILNNSNRSLWTAIFFHWIYTYMAQVVSTGVTRSPLYNWIESLPYVIAAVAIAVLWKKGRAKPTLETIRTSSS